MSYVGFYIVDPLQNISMGNISPICEKLSSWLDPIVQKAGFDWVHVCFPQYIVIPKPSDVIVYICSYEHSVVQLAPGAKGLIPNPSTSSHKGITLIGPPAASEVYLKESNPLSVAALIFHEAMHNQLQTNNSMHGKFPSPILSGAMIDISSEIKPTEAESNAMSEALKKPVNQWTDGQQILWNAAQKRDSGDAVWDSDIKYQI